MAILAAVGGNMYRMAENCAAGTEINLFDRMALLAVGLHTKSVFTIVTCTARTTFFHICHGGTFAGFAGIENGAVALDTFEHAIVNGMTEICGASLIDFENNIDCCFVTFITITFYAEHGRTIMATAARCTLLHLCHDYPFVIRAGVEQLVVAISTGVHGKVFIMIKAGVIGKQDLFDRVALTARLDAESGFAVMARSA